MWNGQPSRAKLYDKVLALLAYLIAEPDRNHSREQLATLFWPALSSDSSRTNLRQALYYLRRALGPSAEVLISSHRDTVRFLYNSTHCQIDLKHLIEPGPVCSECATTSRQVLCAACLSHLKTRIKAYHGEFLEGLSLAEAPDFDIWLDAKRHSFRGQAYALAEQLRNACESLGRLDEALVYAQRCTQLEPWNETGQYQHMHLLARKGQHGTAENFYDAYRSELARDLDAEPQHSTKTLFETIHKGGLETRRKSPIQELHPPTPTETGRRQATILCCHIGLPPDHPEWMPEQLAAPRSACASILRRYAGHIAPGQDGYIYAYMDYPHTFEHAALRAVQAAQALQAHFDSRYRFRAGIHTGIIVTGFDPALPDIIGDVSAVAWRMCRRMQRGGIAISDTTRRLLRGQFHLEPMKPLSLKGMPDGPLGPYVPIYKLGKAQQADDTQIPEPRPAIIGRKPELQRLRQLWSLASEGRPQFMVLRGEAGLGKTRLAQALRDEITSSQTVIRHLHCSLERQHTPFYPVIALFESILGFSMDDTVTQQREKLQRYLAQHHPTIAPQAYAILTAMLSIAPLDAPVLPPRQRKQQTLDMLLTLLNSVAMRGAMLLLIEDAQWLDITSLDILERLVHRQDQVPFFTLITARNEFKPPWLPMDSVLALQPLKDEHIARLAQITGKSLSSRAVANIVQRAGGVPLYAEEMAHLSSVSTQESDDIPPSLHYLLRTRLDTVPHARRLLQLAATVGPQFERGLLQRVCGLSTDDLTIILHQLTEAHLIAPVAPLNEVFQFHHRLIQEAAYASQLQEDKKKCPSAGGRYAA